MTCHFRGKITKIRYLDGNFFSIFENKKIIKKNCLKLIKFVMLHQHTINFFFIENLQMPPFGYASFS